MIGGGSRADDVGSGVLACLLLLNAVAAKPVEVYAPPTFRREAAVVAEQGPDVAGEASIGWASDYVFRGVEPVEPGGREDVGHVPVAGRLELDGAVRPWVGLVTDFADDNGFAVQVVRPAAGVAWDVGAVEVDLWHESFLYPDVGEPNTNEVAARLTFVGDREALAPPRLQPFALAAYDYDAHDGLYLELGTRLRLTPPESDLALHVEALAAYVHDHEYFAADDDTGWQRYDVSLLASYELNELLNLPQRRGTVTLDARLTYTGGLDDDLQADEQLHGGVGLRWAF
jgi:hypothetical protein